MTFDKYFTKESNNFYIYKEHNDKHSLNINFQKMNFLKIYAFNIRKKYFE